MRTLRLHVRITAALIALTFGMIWVWLIPDTRSTPAVPKTVVLRTAVLTALRTGLWDDLFGWTGECWAQAGLFGVGTIIMATAAPESLGVSVAAWSLTGVGAATAADACAGAPSRPLNVKECFTAANYKGTYNGIKYYRGAGTCATGMGGGGTGGGGW